MALRLSEEEKSRRHEEALKMFQQGMPKSRIRKELKIDSYELNCVLDEHGCNRQGTRPSDNDILNIRYREAVNAEEIRNIYKGTKIGDVLFVRTEKSDKENGDDIPVQNRTKTGSIRKGVVVSKTPRLCIVKLKSGVQEAFMWRDIVMAQREHKRCIG